MTVPPPGKSPLTISVFGPFSAWLNGAPLPPLRSRKGQWLLALLILRHPAEVERLRLAETLWPDPLEPTQLGNLRMSLKDLRRALGPEKSRLCSGTPHTLSIDLDGADVDVLAFDQAIARGDPASLAQAVALYRGPLLQGCVEAWVLPERLSREQACLQALESLAMAALAAGDRAAAERYLYQAAAVDPLRDTSHRALMAVLASEGNHSAAIQVYHNLRRRLRKEINAEPNPETQALFEQLQAEARHQAGARDHALPAGTLPGRSRVSPGRAPRSGASAAVDLTDPRPLTPDPCGPITFLFTDIEGSTRLWEEHPEAMRAALARHDALLRQAIEGHGGTVFKTMGDQCCAAFAGAPEAVAAALDAQRALRDEPWEETGPLRVRMALHTGTAEEREGDYLGPPLNRVARLLGATHGGQVLLSLATAELARDQLPEGVSLLDLGSRRLRDLTLPEHIFQAVAPDLPADFPPLRSLEPQDSLRGYPLANDAHCPHHLPLPLSRFIGREDQMAEIQQRLSSHRLVTLTGAGGCGKTRLALQVAADLLEEYPDGVWFVDFAPLEDPSLVTQSAAAALALREEPGRPITQTLVDYLRPRQLLLVLDNCEHLLTACARLAETLLQACPRLRVLATSRERLAIAGEQPYRVPPLSLPHPRPEPSPRRPQTAGALLPYDLEVLAQYEAVCLFLDRAATASPSFALTPENAGAVVEVCRRLDGIPLAIELAAAWTHLLPVEQIQARLDDRFRLLTRGSRTALPRQQTLRALIDWSYDLLAEGERVLLRRLSVFAGGFTCEAAEAVCGGVQVFRCSGVQADNVKDGPALDLAGPESHHPLRGYPTRTPEYLNTEDVLDSLAQLVDKSLVLADARGSEGRYSLLETIREYGRERLEESGESEPLQQQHARFFLAVTQQRAGEEPPWLDRLEREHGNLRAAMAWMLTHSEPEALFRMGTAMARLWYLRGYWSEGRERLAELLALPAPPSEARAMLLRQAGQLAWLQTDYEAARSLLEQSAALYRELSNTEDLPAPLNALGELARTQGDFQTASRYYEESLALLRARGDKGNIAWTLQALGEVAQEQGDAAARALAQESLTLFQEVGDRRGISFALSDLGEVAEAEGDFRTARTLHEESLSIRRELGYKGGIARSLGCLGELIAGQGEYETAAALYRECLELQRELGDRRSIATSLERLAGLAARRGAEAQNAGVTPEEAEAASNPVNPVGCPSSPVSRYERAARLFGAAEALRERLGAPRPPAERPEYERLVNLARDRLGPTAFAAAWAEGRAMPLEEAMDDAACLT